MARTPAALRQDFAALDAEARAFLERQSLPAWVGLYRIVTSSGRGEAISLSWQRGRVLRGDEPLYRGQLPQRAAIISNAASLDPTARYLMRLWMARHRQRLAVRRADRDAEQAAAALFNYLLANPPSLDRAALNIARANVERDAARAAEWRRWQNEADRIWAERPNLSRMAVADLVKARLELSDHVKSIARRLVRKIK